jgi:hypothetical protein
LAGRSTVGFFMASKCAFEVTEKLGEVSWKVHPDFFGNGLTVTMIRTDQIETHAGMKDFVTKKYVYINSEGEIDFDQSKF